MDNIMNQENQEENGIGELMFADDLVLIAEYQGRLLKMVSTLDQQCKKLWYERQDKRSPAENQFSVTYNYMGKS